ncbi:Secreted protein OS=Streptomyces tendae OX=1932 GN=GUR47_27060 PE=4 SV=1 [Streptomyces tendae]
MTTRGRALRYTAISALVVLSLTGFSTGRHGHGHGGDGGGCSSSGQDHDSSSSTSGGGAYKDDDDTYGSGGSGYHDDDTYDDDTGGGSGGGTDAVEAATVTLVVCAKEGQPYATVEVTNPNAAEYTFPVTVLFKDAEGTTLTEGSEEVTVPADGVTPVRVPYDGSAVPDHCELDHTVTEPVS